MVNNIYFTFKKQKKLNQMDLLIIFILFLSNLNIFFCEDKNNLENIFHSSIEIDLSINDTNYFNNIIKFNNKNYKSGKFAINNKGDLILELSDNNDINSRLFYELTKEGRYLFNNKSSYTQEINININQQILSNNKGYNDFSLFVSIYNNSNINKQYLFSINSNYPLVELFDLNDKSNENYIWSLYEFFGMNSIDYNFEYKYSLFEIKDESSYLIAVIPKNIINNNIALNKFIIKFSFKSFDSEVYNEIKSINYEPFLNSTIINIFCMDEINTLVIFVCTYVEIGNITQNGTNQQGHQTQENIENQKINKNSSDHTSNTIPGNKPTVINNGDETTNTNPDVQTSRRRLENKQKYKFKLYDKNLNYVNYIDYLEFSIQVEQLINFKSIYLGNNYTIFSYIINNNETIVFSLLEINNLKNEVNNKSSFEQDLYNFYLDKESLSDFIKIHDKKLCFIYKGLTQRNIRFLSIIIIDVSTNFNNLSSKTYYISNEYLIPKLQISAFEYNGYLLFATTAIEENLNQEGDENYFSLLMIFGYANGTDSTIDISYYLFDSENYGKINKSFFDILYENFTIENNIFNYTSTNRIKLVSIPNEIIISNEADLIQNNSEIYLSNDYTLKQNTNLIKTSQYYYIDYQYIIKEQSNSQTNEALFYSRTNRLKFKLCYDYCQTCNELGIKENDQKCLSCLPKYQYDYNNNNISQGICVPEGYYYDVQINSLILCNSTENINYIDLNDNKKICFKEILIDIQIESHKVIIEKNYNKTDNIYNAIKSEYIGNYDKAQDNYIKFDAYNNYSFQLTTVNNQIDSLLKNLKSEFSVIDLKECAGILNKKNGLQENEDLIILKYENEKETINNGNQRSIQYEVYEPNSNSKLDLSPCSNTTIDIYIPIQLSEETKKLYEDLKNQGYNLFDKNDKFYTDICTPYKTENGTDILLVDRYNDFYIKNQLNCQANCEFEDYLSDSEYLKCKCNVVNEEKIETKQPEKITAKSTLNSFYNILKYSNYKVLKCYKLVLRKKTLYENKGSALAIIYFLGFFMGLIIFCFRRFIYIKKEVSGLFIKGKIEKKTEKDKKKHSLFKYNKNKENKELKENGSKKNDIYK